MGECIGFLVRKLASVSVVKTAPPANVEREALATLGGVVAVGTIRRLDADNACQARYCVLPMMAWHPGVIVRQKLNFEPLGLFETGCCSYVRPVFTALGLDYVGNHVRVLQAIGGWLVSGFRTDRRCRRDETPSDSG